MKCTDSWLLLGARNHWKSSSHEEEMDDSCESYSLERGVIDGIL